MGNNTTRQQRVYDLKLNKDFYAAIKNDLILARQKETSIWATRLLNFLVMQIVSEDRDLKTYRVKITDLAEFVGVERSGDLYADIKAACKEAMGKVAQIGSDDPSEPWKMLAWLSKAEYDGKGTLYLSLSEDLKPYLLNLKEMGYFTQYQIREILPMNSTYAVRLYQLITLENNKWRGNIDYVEKSIEELREYFGCDKTTGKFKQISQFKAGVIETAVRQINRNPESMFKIRVEYIKTGRFVTGVRFHLRMGPLEKRKLQLGSTKSDQDQLQLY